MRLWPSALLPTAQHLWLSHRQLHLADWSSFHTVRVGIYVTFRHSSAANFVIASLCTQSACHIRPHVCKAVCGFPLSETSAADTELLIAPKTLWESFIVKLFPGSFLLCLQDFTCSARSFLAILTNISTNPSPTKYKNFMSLLWFFSSNILSSLSGLLLVYAYFYLTSRGFVWSLPHPQCLGPSMQ